MEEKGSQHVPPGEGEDSKTFTIIKASSMARKPRTKDTTVSPGSSSRNVFSDGHVPAFNSVWKRVKKITLKPKICAAPKPFHQEHTG